MKSTAVEIKTGKAAAETRPPATDASTERAPGMQPPQPRPLAGRKILLDTYNLRLKQGSGIKTYGITLAESVRLAGAEVSLLGDRPVARSARQGLDEVLFYDLPRRRSRLVGPFRDLLATLKRLFRPAQTSAIANRFVVPDRPIRAVPGDPTIYNVSRIYDSANEAFRRLGRMTRVRVPKPIDLWHATTLLPIRVEGAPMVTTVHDLIPLRLPYTTLDDKRFFYKLLRESIFASDLVLTVSESTKRDLLMFFPEVPEQKVVVTYQSVPFCLYQPDAAREDAAMQRYKLRRGRYVLFVGNIEPKKNVRSIIQAAASLPSDVPLVIVGRKGWLYEEELESAPLHCGPEWERRVRLLDYVPRDDLHALYACASCLAFPSLYEGFGLPPLEAFAHGCPVVVSNVASLPEVCADAALYCDPYESDSLRERIVQILEDDSLRRDLIQRGYKRLDEFSTARYAERLVKAYRMVL